MQKSIAWLESNSKILNSEKIIRKLEIPCKINVKATPSSWINYFYPPFRKTLCILYPLEHKLKQRYNTKMFLIKFVSTIPNIFPRASITKAALFAMILAIFPSEITSLCKPDGNTRPYLIFWNNIAMQFIHYPLKKLRTTVDKNFVKKLMDKNYKLKSVLSYKALCIINKNHLSF